MRRAIAATLVLLALLVIGLLWPIMPSPVDRGAATSGVPNSPVVAARDGGRDPPQLHAGRASSPESASRARDRVRRDALRERILERERVVHDTAIDRRQDDASAPDRDPQAPGITNRMGEGHDDLAAVINRDFLPLAQECIDDALERTPALRGMLAIGIEAIGDDELGAVIDAVEYPATNEIVDPALLECVRETALSMSLPPPASDGRTAFMLTLGVGELIGLVDIVE